MPIIMLQMIALVFQRVKCLVFYLPACAPSPDDFVNVSRSDFNVRYPAKILNLAAFGLPIFHHVDKHVGVGRVEAKAVGKAVSAQHALLVRDLHFLGRTGFLAGIQLFEQIGVPRRLGTDDETVRQ